MQGERELAAAVAALRGEVAALRRRLEALLPSVEGTLRRRGLRWSGVGPPEDLLFPPGLSLENQEALYEQLKRYSFRLFLRELIARKERFRPDDLTRFCAPDVARRYLDFLLGHGIIERVGRGAYRLVNAAARNFGGTLEWLVAQALLREFGAPALWGVRLADVAAGGDYDVLALVDRALIYVEAKSSPPKHIEAEEVAAFLGRVREVQPNLAIFLVDTELRMKDKVVPTFEAELRRLFGRGAGRRHPVERVVDEIFSLDGWILIANSKPSLLGNLGRCLRWWFGAEGARGRGNAFVP